MMKFKGKKFLVVIVMLAMLMLISNISFASSNLEGLIPTAETTPTATATSTTVPTATPTLTATATSIPTATATATSIPTATATSTAKVTSTATAAANTSSSYNNTNLPKTGSNSVTVLVVMAVFGISAVYAYNKIRDYKDM